MNSNRSNDLHAAWQAADDRHCRLVRSWRWTRLAMWLIAAIAVVLLAAGTGVLIPARLIAASLTLGVGHALMQALAGRAVKRRWQDAADYAEYYPPTGRPFNEANVPDTWGRP